MCFKENVSFFKAINWCFFTFHLIFMAACVIVITTRDKPLTLYYQMEVTHDTYIDVYPIYAAVICHAFGILFHFMFAVGGGYILTDYIGYSFTNPLRWFLQFGVDGASLLGLMLIHGFHQLETIVLILVIYAAVLVLCYYQDHYLNPSNNFNPDKGPHTFAIPIHVTMIFMIIAKANEHITDEKTMQIAMTTLVSLSLTLVSYVIQKFHIAYRSSNVSSYVEDDDEDDDDDDEETARLENVAQNSKMKTDHIDAVLNEIRRGIKYEAYHYINSILFAMTVTWFILNITQSDQQLHK